MAAGNRQRIDKWIWFARVVRSREAAVALVEAGHVRVNKVRVTKPGYDVSPGDVLTIAAHGRVLVLEVLAFAERRGPAGTAVHLYRDADAAGSDGAAQKKRDASGSGTC